MPEFAVIIPHYNDVVRLTRCLEALMPQIAGDVEVVVADNGSTESLEPVREQWPSARIVIQPEKGAGPARNAGVATTTAPWLGFLDADVIPSADWLAVARRIAADNIVWGGQVKMFDETPPLRSGAEAFETVFAFRVDSYLDKGFLATCQLVMARATFDAVGGFRVGVSEDVDWSRRAVAAGYQLALAPELQVSHPSRSDWPALLRKWRRLTSEGFLTEAWGAQGRLRWALRALAMPVSVLVHLPQVLTHPGLSGRERGRAVLTLVRLRGVRMVWMLKQALRGRP